MLRATAQCGRVPHKHVWTWLNRATADSVAGKEDVGAARAQDAIAVGADGASQLHEGLEPGAAGPGEPGRGIGGRPAWTNAPRGFRR